MQGQDGNLERVCVGECEDRLKGKGCEVKSKTKLEGIIWECLF